MKKIKIFFAIFLSLLLASPPSALAEAIATITYIEGRADRLQQDGERYLPVVIGEEISVGDKIRTKSYSKAEITFADNSVVRLGDSSQIKVKEYEVDEEGRRRKGTIDLDRGRIRTIVSKTKDKTAFNVNTPNASGSVKGSDVFISYQKSTTGILVADGIFSTLNPEFPDLTINIPKGKTSVVPYNAPPKDPRIYLPFEKEHFESETGPTIRRLEKDIREAESILTTIVRATGDVRVYPRGQKAWHGASINEVLNTGDIIETKEDGRIQITLDNGHIIELRPNTYFIIKSLSRNPKTGDYENSFECRYGKVRAKLQKVSKNSSFKVKTPTAVCGVLGTIMYLDVSPTSTKAFFEGGEGFINNLISGVNKIIEAGKSSSADDQGGVSDPTDTTDEERSEFGSEFGSEGSDDDTYGYSEPEGDPGDDYADAGLDTGADGPDEPDVPGEGPFELPQEPGAPTGGGGTVGPVLPINFSGVWNPDPRNSETYSLQMGFLPAGEVYGAISATGNSAVVNASGEYYYYQHAREPLTWLTHIHGGAYFGFTGGSWNDNTMEGQLASIYIDSEGYVGYINGNVSGSYYPFTFPLEEVNYIDLDSGPRFEAAIGDYPHFGSWRAESTLTATQMNYIPGITPENFEIDQDIFGGLGLSNDSDIYAEALGDSLSLEGEGWGIWELMFLGVILSETPPSVSWSVPLVGTITDVGDDIPDGYWLGLINGSEWVPGEPLRGEFNAVWLTPDNDGITYGTASGDVIGNTDLNIDEYIEVDDGESIEMWQAAGMGQWVEVEELFDLASLTEQLEDIAQLDIVSIPITESGLLQGSCKGGITSAAMDLTLYALDAAALQGIWAAIFNGTYDAGGVLESWSVSFEADESIDIKLQGLEWSDNEWLATVDGTIDEKHLTGTAAGTYSDQQFSGTGAGVWLNDEAIEDAADAFENILDE